MRNNKGVSLIELIIAIAILAVLAGSTVGAVRYIQYGNTKRCAYKINAKIDEVRFQDMSKVNKPSLYIYQYQGDYYMKIMGTEVANPAAALDGDGIKLANSQVRLYYRTSKMVSTDADVLIQDAVAPGIPVYLKLEFTKDTGAVKPIAPSSYVNEILVRDDNGSLRYTITLVQITGKHFVN